MCRNPELRYMCWIYCARDALKTASRGVGAVNGALILKQSGAQVKLSDHRAGVTAFRQRSKMAAF